MIAWHDINDTNIVNRCLTSVAVIVDYDCDAAVNHLVRCLTFDRSIDVDDINTIVDCQSIDRRLSIAYRVRHGCNTVRDVNIKSANHRSIVGSLFESTRSPVDIDRRSSMIDRNDRYASHVIVLRDANVIIRRY